MSTEFRIKMVLVGDKAVGKTCFCFNFSTNKFPADYQRLRFDNCHDYSLMVDGKPIGLTLCDTAGHEDYDRLRPLLYPQTDVSMICFAVDSMTSFLNVREKWAPEVKHYCPNTPIVLVGMKSDLRASEDSNSADVSPEQATDMAKEIGAVGYFETSALTQHGVVDTVMAAIRARLSGSGSKGAGRGRRIFRWPWRKSSKNGSGDSSSEPREVEEEKGEKRKGKSKSKSCFCAGF